MKAEEIRLGNYYSNNGSVCSVTPNVIQEVYESERSWCKPIPLTEEWLVKAGFVSDNYGTFYIDCVGRELWCKYYKNGNLCGWSWSIGFGDNMFKLPDKNNVHEIQNLYYGITGEELTFNHQNQIK